jgi:hypothetical protein
MRLPMTMKCTSADGLKDETSLSFLGLVILTSHQFVDRAIMMSQRQLSTRGHDV